MGSSPGVLLAKSPRKNMTLSLQKHCHDTEEAANCLFPPTGRWGRAWRRFFRLDEASAQRFLLNLQVAALFHDLGKANEDFYRAVSKEGFFPQSVRHEHLSALVLHLPEVAQWLRGNPALDHGIICAAVLSHHSKAEESGKWEWCAPKAAKIVRMYLQHAEVGAILGRVASIAELAAPPALPTEPWEAAGVWSDALASGRDAARKMTRALRNDTTRKSLLLAVKAGVIVADAAASGLVRTGKPITDWISERAEAFAIGSDDIQTKIIKPRTEQIEGIRQLREPGWCFTFHKFQEGMAAQGPRALVLAACGTGKTLAAWRWAEEQARRRDIGRVVFLYPTRATATEGFRDYVGWAPEADASLIHGTSRYELDAIARTPDETPSARGKSFAPTQEDEMLRALGYWSRRYFSATVDQFLGFMEHGHGGMCMLPVLADSALVIDEIHSFDENMFKNLVAFLKAFDVPVLCMTATLQPSRRKDLVDAGLTVYPREEHRAALPDLAAEENAPRYRVTQMPDPSTAHGRAVAAYRTGKRVLWVVNTVDRCQEVARNLRAQLGGTVYTYHSRFTLKDRQTRHNDVVAAFKQRERPEIAVTTQVCEMSLDLDADVLVSEIAPVTSLVQRFGRSNRDRSKKPADFRAEVMVYEPPGVKPYTADDFKAARAFLTALGDAEVSQSRLAQCLADHAPGEPLADGGARFLDSGYYATAGSLRDIEEFNESCVLDDDLAALRPLVDTHGSWDGYVLPVPRKEVLPEDAKPAWLPKWVNVARASRYNATDGYIKEGAAV